MGILGASVRFARRCVLALVLVAGVPVHAQEVSLEYQLKAAYLFNFLKFVEWPPDGESGPFTLCVAGRNPFGDVLTETLRNETVNARALTTRVIVRPDPGCRVVFLPQGTAPTPYLRAARGSPILTVGEAPGFIAQGGIINFVREEGTIRFQINAREAARAELRISSHLLRLARVSPDRYDEP